MKKIFSLKTWFLLILVIPMIYSCKVHDYPELVDPLSIKVQDLNGTWQVNKVSQYDQEAIDNGFPLEVQTQDITSSFTFSEYQIKFDLDAQGRPSTFTVTPGNAPNFLPLNSGKWSVDNAIFTTKIDLFEETNPNSSTFRVKRISQDLLSLQYLRSATDGTLYLFYEYEFKRK